MGPAALAAALLAVPLLAGPLHGPIKRATHARLAAAISAPSHLGLVAAVQRRRHRALDAAVAISAASVTVEFYLSLLPLLVWTLPAGPQLVARLVALLGLAGYAVFAIKDLLEAPRPGDVAAKAGLALHVHDNCGDIEDGIPSAHVSGSVLLLFYGIEAAAAAGWLSSSGGGGGGADPGLLLALQLAAAAWVAWVAWGRLYLGLHSPADLAAGGLLGWLLLALWRELEAPYTAWLESGAGGLPQQLQVLTAAAALMRCYPMATRRRTSCYEHATCWCGGWTGVTLGYLHMRARGMHGAAADTAAAAQQQLMPWRMQLPLMAAKVAVGLLVMVATKVAVKQACLALLPHAFSCVPTWVRCLWQPPVAGMPPREAAAGAAAGGSAAAKLQQGAKAPRSRRGGGDDSRGSSDGVPQHDQDGDGSAARCSSSDGPHASSSGGSSWVLRHGPSGTANDVEAASRFASWAVMCFAILTLDAWWQRLVRQLAFSTSLA